MTEYVCHMPYEGHTMYNEEVCVPKGARLVRQDGVLVYGVTPICVYRSLIGKKHFSRNDDGLGMERGALTFAIAYAPRLRFSGSDSEKMGSQQRFSDDELAVITNRWGDYIKPDTDFILFNDKFFDETPSVLREIARSVNIEFPAGGKEDVSDCE
ncbi:MAG: hypothetical protein IJU76_14200 [Desulfovibrionaceae bacterium]|nr:hypothetical protein [Desulfovibrionaceae bacterium]